MARLREGLIYGMLHLPIAHYIRLLTLQNLHRLFTIDAEQARRVRQLAEIFSIKSALTVS